MSPDPEGEAAPSEAGNAGDGGKGPGPEEADEAGEGAEGVCELCGGPTVELHCKIICLNCGYKRDCSDP